MLRPLTLLAALIAIVFAPPHASAHAAPHSIVLLDLRADDVGAELRLPVPELEAALHRPMLSAQPTLFDGDRDAIRALVARDLHAVSADGQSWKIDVDALRSDIDDRVPVVVVSVKLTPPRAHSPQVFRLVDDVIGNDVPNHAAWIGLRSDFAHGVIAGSPTVVGVTGYLHHSVLIDRAGGGASGGFRATFCFGMQHIADGIDHLLFLFALVLPAPLLFVRSANGTPRWGGDAGVRASFGKLARVVTAFTVGHSLTLLIGAPGWMRLPTAPVETLIAVSILVSAAHAMRPIFPGREAWVAGGFGLIHGLAFAGALAKLRLDPPRLALALLGFNLGIEAMQLVVVAATFPWLLLLARTPLYTPLRSLGATFAGAASIGWIAERAFHAKSPMDAIVTSLAAHPLLLAGMLATVAIGATFGSKRVERAPPLWV